MAWKCGLAAYRADPWPNRAVKARIAQYLTTSECQLTIFQQISSMSAVTVWGDKSPKGRYLDSKSQTSELMILLLYLSKGRKYWTVKFQNWDLRKVFLRMSLPILLKMRRTTSFSASVEVLELRILALYSTILISYAFQLKERQFTDISTRSKTALLTGQQERSSSLLTYSTSSPVNMLISYWLLQHKGKRTALQNRFLIYSSLTINRKFYFFTTSCRQFISVLRIFQLPLRLATS